MSAAANLTPETVEAIALRVAELIHSSASPDAELSNDHERSASGDAERSGSQDPEVETAGTSASGDAEVPRLVDATEIARRFNVSRDYVYEHAPELGAVRLGTGPKARLRFNPERVLEALSPQPFQPTAESSTRRRPRRTTSVDLLPIGRKR